MSDEPAGITPDSDVVSWLLADFASGLEAAATRSRELAESIRSTGLLASVEESAAFAKVMDLTCEWRKIITATITLDMQE